MPRLPRPALGCKGYPGPARRALVIGHVSGRQLGAARCQPAWARQGASPGAWARQGAKEEKGAAQGRGAVAGARPLWI